MKQLISIFIIVICGISYAQVEPSKQRHNFGDLYKGSVTYTDIVFTNNSDKPQYLLTIDKPKDVYYIYSGKTMLPDSSITIRFKINENIKGRFTHNVDVYFSSPRAAIPIQLNGNVKQAEGSTSMTACPDFNNQPPAYQATSFDVIIRVIDSLTREPIKGSKVYLVQNGQLIGEYVTNNKGIVTKKIPLGYYYITAKKEPYNSNYKEGYLNFKRNYVEIELQKDVQEEIELIPPPEVEEEIVEVIEEKPDPIIEEEIVVVIEEKPDPIVEEEEIVIEIQPDTAVINPQVDPVDEVEIVEEVVEEVEEIALEELPDSVFTNSYFKYNNITFILDVSTSMNGMGKMNLLKTSMIELTEILRSNDIISMVKYSSEVEVILKNVSGDRKEEIVEVVNGLKTSGMTAGGNAIKSAYKLNKKTYIPEGNNIVIMITDGVFNKGDKDYLKTIQNTYKSKGTIFSVVGIKTSDYITKHMKNIVEKGGGHFIRILNEEDAKTKLIAEIKRTSFKFSETAEN